MNSTGRRALDGCPMFALANVGRKSRATRISGYAALDRTACAPFREERRMHSINATNSNRKSGESPSNALNRSRLRLFIRTGEVICLRPTQGDGNRPSVRRPFPHEASRSPLSSLNPNNRSQMEAPPSPCHPEEPTYLRQVKGAMNSTGHRALDGAPCSRQRTWAEKAGRSPSNAFSRSRVRLFIRSEAEGPAVLRTFRGFDLRLRGKLREQ